MNFKQFRKNLRHSQRSMAAALQEYAAIHFPEGARKLDQRTLANWEVNLCMPHRYWLVVIEHFSKGEVTASDFASQGFELKCVKKKDKMAAADYGA